jgi:hypothetical protein
MLHLIENNLNNIINHIIFCPNGGIMEEYCESPFDNVVTGDAYSKSLPFVKLNE